MPWRCGTASQTWRSTSAPRRVYLPADRCDGFNGEDGGMGLWSLSSLSVAAFHKPFWDNSRFSCIGNGVGWDNQKHLPFHLDVSVILSWKPSCKIRLSGCLKKPQKFYKFYKYKPQKHSMVDCPQVLNGFLGEKMNHCIGSVKDALYNFKGHILENANTIIKAWPINVNLVFFFFDKHKREIQWL